MFAVPYVPVVLLEIVHTVTAFLLMYLGRPMDRPSESY
jgi:hypothetical protein